ncbi:hypothetical protein FIBSPDRAFT_947380 [Athelia psychrophila]|uniref:Uncharacterized protein n=1 Tax=Athelia psychrophila TaxID=1759441 RepID=A0A166S3Z7_9AGAM|nr:hypothetical protein FIBSPDRAFT_947380 [Fibularhizoctonia sp. CBS 109695]
MLTQSLVTAWKVDEALHALKGLDQESNDPGWDGQCPWSADEIKNGCLPTLPEEKKTPSPAKMNRVALKTAWRNRPQLARQFAYYQARYERLCHTRSGAPKIVSLRTIKSDVAVGFGDGGDELAEKLDKEELGWKISGKYVSFHLLCGRVYERTCISRKAVVLLSEGRPGEPVRFA